MTLIRRVVLSLFAFVLPALAVQAAPHPTDPPLRTGSVIFIHPDGMSAATWEIARALYVGPDADLHWDQLPSIAVYRGHLADNFTASSNAGATIHANGVKVATDAFGRSAGGDAGTDLLDADGQPRSVALQAIRRGMPVALVQTGAAQEPGTAAFVVASASRRNDDEICAGLLESGVDIMLSGGERYFLPEGAAGVHGPGSRKDGRNLIDEARARGFEVVRTREELMALPDSTRRVLGLFAHDATFNEETEENLAAAGKPLFEPHAPSVAEMTSVALRLLAARASPFLLVVEEEGTDNFGNNNNAAGVLESVRRADEAIGVARAYVHEYPDTLLLTTADSDAGGMRAIGLRTWPGRTLPQTLPARDGNGAPIDGVAGTGTAPFLAMPDRAGVRLPFYVVWASGNDLSGGILVRADGLNRHLVRGSMDNTQIAEVIRATLFGQAPAKLPVIGR